MTKSCYWNQLEYWGKCWSFIDILARINTYFFKECMQHVVYFSRLLRLSAGTAIFEIGYTLLPLLNTWLRSAGSQNPKEPFFPYIPLQQPICPHIASLSLIMPSWHFFNLKSFSFIIVTFYNFILIATIILILLSLLASPPPPQPLPHPPFPSLSFYIIHY